MQRQKEETLRKVRGIIKGLFPVKTIFDSCVSTTVHLNFTYKIALLIFYLFYEAVIFYRFLTEAARATKRYKIACISQLGSPATFIRAQYVIRGKYTKARGGRGKEKRAGAGEIA